MENKICKRCGTEFILDQDDLSFYEKMQVQAPNVCSDCRFKMRAVWRNEMSLYSGRNCDLCGKSILSMYNPDSSYKVYCNECFYSDVWDPEQYAEDYDPGRHFFDQLNDFLQKVPKNTTYLSTSDGPNINSDYCNMAGGMKDCYMAFNGGIGEGIMYSRGVRMSNDTVDCYFSENVERNYECVNTFKSSGLVFCQNVSDSLDCVFCLNCRNMSNCLGCVNLVGKSHHIFNSPVSPEEYKEKLKEIMGSHSKMSEFRKSFDEFSLKFPRRENCNLKTVTSTGDFLIECKDVKDSFEAMHAENSKYLFSTRNAKDSHGLIGYGYKGEMLLECVAVGYSSRVVGSATINDSSDILYSFGLKNCRNCIGCDGLRNSNYCVFNKRLGKEEYLFIRDRIIDELKYTGVYGLMMPPELSPFGYNESVGQDNMPMTKEEAMSGGFKWQDEVQKTEGKETLLPENIPDHINDVDDSIKDDILRCADCGRNYKITEQELSFYRKMMLPIPQKCFFSRHKDRVLRRGPYKFWERNCAKCNKRISTNYAPDRPEIVYCEDCYRKEVY